MTANTLDNLTPAELRDLATRATNAAEVQEKAEAEKKRLADEAKKAEDAKPVFKLGPYELRKDGKLWFTGSMFSGPKVSAFDSMSDERYAVSRIMEGLPGGPDENALLDFLVAYRQSLRDKKAREAASGSGFNAWMNNLYGSQNYGYQNMYSFGNTIR